MFLTKARPAPMPTADALAAIDAEVQAATAARAAADATLDEIFRAFDTASGPAKEILQHRRDEARLRLNEAAVRVDDATARKATLIDALRQAAAEDFRPEFEELMVHYHAAVDALQRMDD